MVLPPDEELAARTICTLFMLSAIDTVELFQAQREMDAEYKSAIAGRNDETRALEQRIETLQIDAATKQTSVEKQDEEIQANTVRCAELISDLHDQERDSTNLLKQIAERQTRLSKVKNKILEAELVCQKLKGEEIRMGKKKTMLDDIEKTLQISGAKLDDEKRILRGAQLENHAAATSVERQRNEVQNKISSLNLSRDLLRQCVQQIAPLLLIDNDPTVGTLYCQSLRDIIVQKHLDLSEEVVAQKRIIDQATARLNETTAAYEEQLKKTSRLSSANESLGNQLAATIHSNQKKAEWRMAKIRLDSLAERMESDLAAVAETEKAWDDRVLQIRKGSRRKK
ncbi:MAG: hypothetical protein LQ347_004646 [Umbilicaria vellea]|nr:MAG: hypothetical protein LQ347_004646 [Umbilicaria vellea]